MARLCPVVSKVRTRHVMLTQPYNLELRYAEIDSDEEVEDLFKNRDRYTFDENQFEDKKTTKKKRNKKEEKHRLNKKLSVVEELVTAKVTPSTHT